MKLVEFKSVDNAGNEFIVFVNPDHVESVYKFMNSDNAGLNFTSGKSIEVHETLEKVKEKLGINVEGTDYKRTDKSH